jgi:hypothetical protein
VPNQTLAAAALNRAQLASFVPPAIAVAPMAVGAALGAGVMVIAAGRASGLWTRSVRRERTEGQPWWQRLYLDVALAVICLLAYGDLTQFGTLGVREDLGQQATSPLLLVTPDLLLRRASCCSCDSSPSSRGWASGLLAAHAVPPARWPSPTSPTTPDPPAGWRSW